MNEKKFTLCNLLLILSIIVIIIMSVAVFKLYSNNTKQAQQITTLESELSKLNSKIESISKENTVEPIILDGIYGMGASELSIIPSKDGNISFNTNSTSLTGTYKTISKNVIEITFTKEIYSDPDDITEDYTKDISKIEHFYIIDNNTLIYIPEDTTEFKPLLLNKDK